MGSSRPSTSTVAFTRKESKTLLIRDKFAEHCSFAVSWHLPKNLTLKCCCLKKPYSLQVLYGWAFVGVVVLHLRLYVPSVGLEIK